MILAAAVWLWNGGTVALPFDDSKLWTLGRETTPWLDGEVFRYFLPAMFDSLIQEIIVDRPTIVVVVLIGFIGLSVIRTRMKRTTLDRSAAVRDKIITAGAPLGDPTPPATVTQP